MTRFLSPSFLVLFDRAYGTAVSLPDPATSLGPDHVFKINAIALSLADVLENYDLPAAYSVYETALADVRSREMSVRERIRAVSIAVKLGDVGEQLLRTNNRSGSSGKKDDVKYGPVDEGEVEGYYSWALEESLRAIPPKEGERKVVSDDRTAESSQERLQLPHWVEGIDLVSVMERLAAYYTRKGQMELSSMLCHARPDPLQD